MVLATAVIAGICSAMESVRLSSYNLEELEPYIEHTGDILTDGTLYLDSEQIKRIERVEIAGIEGAVSYELLGYDRVFNYAGKMKWKSNEDGYSSDDYKNVRQAVINQYSVDTGKSLPEDSTSFRCSNNVYSSIDCNLLKDGTIEIIWAYDSENYVKTSKASTATKPDLEVGQTVYKESVDGSVIEDQYKLIPDELMDDKLKGLLSYIDLSFSESGLAKSDAWNAMGSSFVVGEACFWTGRAR